MKSDNFSILRTEVVIAIAMFIIIMYQLMIPPIVGLANNGDFHRIMPWAGLEYLSGDYHDRYFSFINRKFIITQEIYGKYISSEVLFLRISAWVSKLISKDGLFDLRLIGFLHGLVLIFSIYFILMILRKQGVPPYIRIILGGLIIVIFCDVGYVSYFNSLYSEPASMIFLLLLIGTVIFITTRDKPSWLGLVSFFLMALLFISAKAQHALMGVLFMIYGFFLSRLWQHYRWKLLTVILALFLGLSSIFLYSKDPKELKRDNLYQSVFYGILKDSPTPQADLMELGLKTKYMRLIGTTPYSLNLPVDQLDLENDFYNNFGYRKVLTFYIKHPDRLFGILRKGAQDAFLIHPNYLGNFEKAAGFPPGFRSKAFGLWGKFKEGFFPHSIWFLILYLSLNLGGIVWGYFKTRRKTPYSLMLIFYGLLGLMAVAQMFICVIGAGEADLAKHLFLFNVLFDITLMVIISCLIYKFSNWFKRWVVYMKSSKIH